MNIVLLVGRKSEGKVFLNTHGKRDGAKLQNTGPLLYILMNHNSAYCVMLHS